MAELAIRSSAFYNMEKTAFSVFEETQDDIQLTG